MRLLVKFHYAIIALIFSILLTIPSDFVQAFSYIFAGEANGVDIITHPLGYTGTGGVIAISIGIDPTSANSADMVTPTQNVIATFNALSPTTGNLELGAANNVPFASFDFESVLLHELGHSLGLAHCNAATESGLAGNDRNYTKATDGVDNVFNVAAGVDGIIGSADDVRGDDVNLGWFQIGGNDPFTIAGTVDNTTYTRDVASLPVGDLFVANADRTVGADLGYADSEAAMQQGTFNDEAQRSLGHDDVAGILLAMAGLDETAGTADDYTLSLTYAGLTTAADIVIDFDNSQTGFAVSQSGGAISGSHARVTSTAIYFNTGSSWFFNTAPLPVELLTFDVQDDDGDAKLSWTTTTEVNHSYFEVERSSNAQNWEAIGQVQSENNASGASYTFTDAGYGDYADKILYRIKFVDLDGSTAYSPIRTLTYQLGNSSDLTLAPNPIEETTTLEIELEYNTQVSLQFYDISGRRVYQEQQQGLRGINVLPMGNAFHTLTPGVYLVKVQFGDQLKVLKLVR